MQVTMQTRATQEALRLIIHRDFAGSQAEFSRRCGLDTADTSRVVTGSRPATLQLVRRATAALDDIAASQLLTAFLSDILAVLPKPYSVVVQPFQSRRVEPSGASHNRSPNH